MAKCKEDKKMNRIVKRFNKELREDVFQGRFYCRQIKKQRGCDGIMYYLYEVCDSENPTANKICHWMNIWEANLWLSPLFQDMNTLIVESDFWSKYHKMREGI